MNLGPWKVHMESLGFIYHVPAIALPQGSSVRMIGDNGVGKTVFLEQVLLPRLQEQGRRVFFLTQDLSLQAHVLAATLAAQGLAAPCHLESLVEAWAAGAGTDDVLILDETDRHLRPEYMERLLARPVSAIFLVSHQMRPWPVTHHLSVIRHGRNVIIQEVRP